MPSIAEVRATPTHGRTVASTFAGGGGSSTGYRLAGFRVVWANEFIPLAADTYAANYPETPIDRRDIRTLHARDVLDASGLRAGDLDVLDGSPPCAAFSLAGKQAKLWNMVRPYSSTKQRVDDLFDEYLRLVDELRPRVTIAENVGGLVKGTGKGVFKRILAKLSALGYVVEARRLDAQWLGVPQRRLRVLIVGVRSDLKRRPAFPQPLPYRYSARDAFATLPRNAVLERETRLFPAYEKAARWLVPGVASDRFFNLEIVRPDAPSPTIHAHGQAASAIHWDRRFFSIAELKRLCSFPDDYTLCGNYAVQAERLGRAVPPLMMRALASAIARDVFGVPA